ncbi:MAG TPA: hypothetical protein VHQ90_20595 [Thermoanaerobaculia bacterium]|nr:hypothetical protein [Thermoanaerobaculia bacterium]
MPRRHQTTIQIATRDVAFIERRGGRSHRGGGEFSRSAVFHRLVNMLDMLLDHADPLRNRRIAPAQHELVTRHLSEPWAMTAFEIEHLESYLARNSGFAAAARAAGIDPAELLATLAGLNFYEKMALVDQACQAQSPAAAAAVPEEP